MHGHSSITNGFICVHSHSFAVVVEEFRMNTPLTDWLSAQRHWLRDNPVELRWFLGMAGLFLLAFFLPVGQPRSTMRCWRGWRC